MHRMNSLAVRPARMPCVGNARMRAGRWVSAVGEHPVPGPAVRCAVRQRRCPARPALSQRTSAYTSFLAPVIAALFSGKELTVVHADQISWLRRDPRHLFLGRGHHRPPALAGMGAIGDRQV